MSDIRFNQWLHQSGTGGVSQSDGGHVGIGTTNPLLPVGAGNTNILHVGVVTSNSISAGSSITATTFYGSGANLTGIDTDLVADTSPQLGGDLASNSHDILFADNDKAIFGTGSDFKIYHNGTDNYIMASNGHIRFDTGSAELARITSTGKLLVGTQTEGAANADDLTIATTGTTGITIRSGTSNSGNIYFSDATSGTGEYAGAIEYNHSDNSLRLFTNTGTERLRIASDGNFGFNTSSPSAYALATFNSDNGIQLQGNGQTRILMRDSGGPTNLKMMDIMCDAGTTFFRTINDDYTTATQRAAFRSDGNFVVGNRVGTSSVSTNQPVAFHSARVTPDTASSTVSNGVRCNLYVGSNSGWQAGDGGVIGMGGSRSGSAGQEAMWAYIKGSRQSGNGWEYAGKMELGTAEWGTYNTTKAMTIYADHQLSLHGKDNTMMTFNIGGALRLLIEHTGGGNMRLRNHSSGSVTYSTSSDYRLKENATTISNALSTVKALKPYQYTWKHDGKLGQGFFAHEAQEVLPDVGIVSGTKDEVQTEDDTKHDEQWKKDDPIYQSIDYSKLVPLLTAALQEETAKREALEARVAALEGS